MSMQISVFESARAEFSLSIEEGSASSICLKQVHTSIGYRAEEISNASSIPEGDFLWTTRPKLKIAVKVADCSAILIEGQNSEGKFVAAIHAGWRGTASGIIQNAVKGIQPEGFVRVWISPSICRQHFEVGPEVIEALGPESKRFSKASQNSGKVLLDLKSFQTEQIKAQIPHAQIFASSLCTFCQTEFFSYRRSQGKLPAGHRHFASIQRF